MAEGAAECGKAVGWRRYRVVLYLLLGLVAVEVAVAAARDVWRAYDPDEYYEKPRRCRREARDLVLVGGSPVCEGLDSAALAGTAWQGRPLTKVYNLGLSGGTTTEVWHAVLHGVPTPPRLLVYGLTASDLNDNRDEPHGPRVLLDARDVLAWTRERPESADWCVRHYVRGRLSRVWSLFHFRNGIRLWAADHLEGLDPAATAEARDGLHHAAGLRRDDGFAPRYNMQNGSLVHQRAVGWLPERFPFLEGYRLGSHLRYLHRLLDWARTNGVAVVLVDMPVSAELEQERCPEAFAAYRAALAEVERARGVTVLRATRAAVGLDDTHFADLIHLNKRGTERLTAWLRQGLERESSRVGSDVRAARRGMPR